MRIRLLKEEKTEIKRNRVKYMIKKKSTWKKRTWNWRLSYCVNTKLFKKAFSVKKKKWINNRLSYRKFQQDCNQTTSREYQHNEAIGPKLQAYCQTNIHRRRKRRKRTWTSEQRRRSQNRWSRSGLWFVFPSRRSLLRSSNWRPYNSGLNRERMKKKNGE